MRSLVLEGAALARLTAVPGGPFYDRADLVEQLGNCQVVAVEAEPEGGGEPEIVAYWPIWVAVHLEPLWIAERARTNPAAARQIVEGMRAQLAAHGITAAFAVIEHRDLLTHLPLASRLGFRRVPGDLFAATTIP